MGRIWSSVRGTVAGVRAVAPRRWPIALRGGVCMAAPLLLGAATGHLAEGAQATFGVLAVLYVPDAPFRYRARVVAAVGAALTLAVFLGATAGQAGPLVAALVAGLVAAAASFTGQAAELPPPRELMPVMAVLAATARPAGPAEAAGLAALTAAGALLAWLASMAPAIRRNATRPELAAARAAHDAVSTFETRIGTADAGAARSTAETAVRRAVLAVEQSGVADDDPVAEEAAAAEHRLGVALHLHVEAEGGGLPASPITEVLEPAPVRRRQLRGRLRAATGRPSVIGPAAARLGIAVGLGAAIGSVLDSAFDLGHGYWIGLTACAVLQGSNLGLTRRRFLHRVSGTAVGVLAAYAVLRPSLPVVVLVLVLAVAQGLAELLISVSYGVAVVAITVLSLSLAHLAVPAEGVGDVIGDRLLDTALGAVLALALRLLLWPGATSAGLPAAQAQVLRGVRAVLAAEWSGGNEAAAARRRLRNDHLTLRALQADAVADRPGEPHWPASAAIENLTFLALSLPHRPLPPAPTRAGFLAGLDRLAEVAATGERASAVPELVRVPGYPRTSAAAEAVRELITTAD